MKFFTNEVKIALVALSAIVVLFIGLQFLKGMSIFSSDQAYYVKFNDVTGLSESSPVYANGFRVGVVKSMDYDYSNPGNIVATIDIDPKLTLPVGTKAEIASDFLGNVKLELHFPTPQGKAMQRGDTIEGQTAMGLMEKAAQMLPEVEALLPKLDSILTNVNSIVSNPALNGSINNAEELTASLKNSARQLNTLTAQLNQNVPAMMNKADGVLDNTKTLTANLAELDVKTTLEKVNQTIDNLEQLTARLNSKDGNIGLLMNDTKLYQNLTTSVGSMDSLLRDIKSHPKRYVHFSIFGKKDK